MSRRALIIEASRIKGCSDLPGARADLSNHVSYLKSAIGGAWEDTEIITLSHPTKRQVRQWIQMLGAFDFNYITFSGHGHHVQGSGLDETRLCINNDPVDDEIAVSDLKTAGKCLIIADCCRQLSVREIVAKSFQMALESAEASLRPSRARCRRAFDDAIAAAPVGASVLYSCNVKESAGESSLGGYFTTAILGSAEAWAERGKAGVLGVDSAFNEAAKATTRREPAQHPQSELGRRLTHFPFAVLAY